VPNLVSKGGGKKSKPFLCKKLLDDSCDVCIMQHEPVTSFSLVWPIEPKSFQKSVHPFSVEFRVKILSIRYKFFVHDSMPSEENNQHGLLLRLLESKVLGCSDFSQTHEDDCHFIARSQTSTKICCQLQCF